MRLQYIGDAKDYFKWSRLHDLAKSLLYRDLTIALMMRPDDKSRQGGSIDKYSDRISDFCTELRELKGSEASEDEKHKRFAKLLQGLPERLGASYKISLHKGCEFFYAENGREYFSGFDKKQQIVFVDPDIGFEPKNRKNEHVAYSEIKYIFEQVTEDSIIAVFQDGTMKENLSDFYEKKIKPRLISYGMSFSIARSWNNKAMMIYIAKSEEVLNKIDQLLMFESISVSVDTSGFKIERSTRKKPDFSDSKQDCPICGDKVMPFPRYPRYICRKHKLQDASGRPVTFYNYPGTLGHGCVGKYLDTGEAYLSDTCFAEGIECLAKEARFGGIVVEVK